MKNNVYLIGFAGVGKSTVGRLLAEKRGWRFIDLDDYIEEMVGLSIPEIFAKQGEAQFRIHEKEALSAISHEKGFVVAPGGGVILDKNNWVIMEESGSVVLLDIEFENLYNRLSTADINQRPLFKGRSKEEIAELYEARRRLYKQAALSVPIDGLGVNEVLAAVEKVV